MSIMILIAIAPIFLGLWALHYGWIYADFQGGRFAFHDDEHRREDMGAAVFFGLLMAIFGPIGTLLVFCFTGFAQHGWRLR